MGSTGPTANLMQAESWSVPWQPQVLIYYLAYCRCSVNVCKWMDKLMELLSLKDQTKPFCCFCGWALVLHLPYLNFKMVGAHKSHQRGNRRWACILFQWWGHCFSSLSANKPFACQGTQCCSWWVRALALKTSFNQMMYLKVEGQNCSCISYSFNEKNPPKLASAKIQEEFLL